MNRIPATPHNRLTERRGDNAWIRDELAKPDARIVVIDDGSVAEVRGLPDGIDPVDVRAPILVGADAAGAIVVAVDGSRNAALVGAVESWHDARAALLASDEPSVLLHAVGVANWLARTRHCARCGARLDTAPTGHAAHCPACGADHFPRLEPAVIVRVTDADDRLLLVRQQVWPAGRFSVLAGFVEPGETVEDTIRREVAEEVGVTVGAVRYVASQPWPFPSSLMLGFATDAETTDITLEDDEIVEARWVSRDELTAAMEAGDILVPPSVSIAWRLITDWFGDRQPRTWLEAGRDG